MKKALTIFTFSWMITALFLAIQFEKQEDLQEEKDSIQFHEKKELQDWNIDKIRASKRLWLEKVYQEKLYSINKSLLYLSKINL